jgi:predicted signal transduction protein with EAL and GGDEF domain
MPPGASLLLEENFRSQLKDYGTLYDSVSGLPNSTSFRVSLKQMLANAQETGQEVALVWVDLLNLRREFSIAGEEGAARLISAVSDSLRPWVDSGELISRFSDRCFLLALHRDERTESRLSVILEAAAHHHLQGSEGKPEVAAGVAYFPSDATAPQDLIRFASLAAGYAGRTRSRMAVEFRPEMNIAVQRERDLENDLRIALRENQLSLVYQPQIDLSTGNVLGAESLTRWNHPTRGPIPPAEFIPVAERSNLIHEVFAHSLRRLLADAAAWRKRGIVIPSLAVNASAADIRQENFTTIVERELELNPLVGTQLDIEVTESLLMDDEELFTSRLQALRTIGVQVSLDDFGTRYTGFNSLKGLPLNTMKIDKCFVHGVDRSIQAQSLCRTIVTMARHLKLGAIAEGIEDFGELRALKKIGCHAGQGYLFQRPVPADGFLKFLREWPERKMRPDFARIFLDVEVNPRYEVDPLFGIV